MTDEEQLKLLDLVVGKPELIARSEILKLGLKVRVSSRDGKSMLLTRDYNCDRLNLHLEDGKVIDLTFG